MPTTATSTENTAVVLNYACSDSSSKRRSKFSQPTNVVLMPKASDCSTLWYSAWAAGQ